MSKIEHTFKWKNGVSKSVINDIEKEIENIKNKFGDYYTKQEWTDFTVPSVATGDIKIKSDKLSIHDYMSEEIILSAPNKVVHIINGNDGKEKFRTETMQDGFYINSSKAQPTIFTEIMGNDEFITELGSNKVMVICQGGIDKNNNTISLPEPVGNLTNVNNIEYFEYNFLEILPDGKSKIYTNYIANIACLSRDKKIFFDVQNIIPKYISYIRLKLIYNKEPNTK